MVQFHVRPSEISRAHIFVTQTDPYPSQQTHVLGSG